MMEWSKEKCLNAGLLWLRVLMGVGIAYHGFGKIFGGQIDRFAAGISEMGLPLPTAQILRAVLILIPQQALQSTSIIILPHLMR